MLYQLSLGVSLITQEDDICFRVSSQCRVLSLHSLKFLEDYDPATVAEPRQDGRSKTSVAAIKMKVEVQLPSL